MRDAFAAKAAPTGHNHISDQFRIESGEYYKWLMIRRK
jgi:hypothetical protein